METVVPFSSITPPSVTEAVLANDSALNTTEHGPRCVQSQCFPGGAVSVLVIAESLVSPFREDVTGPNHLLNLFPEDNVNLNICDPNLAYLGINYGW